MESRIKHQLATVLLFIVPQLLTAQISFEGGRVIYDKCQIFFVLKKNCKFV